MHGAFAPQINATATQRARRVALFGLFGSGNLGNDGSIEAFLNFLRRAPFPVEVACICHNQDKVRERFGIDTIPIAPGPAKGTATFNRALFKIPNRLHNMARAVQVARSFDVIAVPGTGILDDFGEPWQGMPYHLAFWGAAARIAGTPFAFVSIGAGPIVHPISRRLMVSAARMAKYRSFRDEASRDFLAALGVKTANDTVTPDIAFSLPAPVGQSPSLAPDAGTQEQVPTVGLGVMAYFGWRHRQQNGQQIYSDYVANLTDFGAWLLERGFRVRLLMGQTEDFPVMEELAGRLREYSHGAFSDRVVAEPVNSLTELMAQMAETEMVVATRFHNVVCSLMAGKPIISIGYAKKNNLLLQAAGLDGFAQHIERLDLDLLKKQFLDLYEHKEKYAPGIKRMTESYRCKLEDQERALLGFISGTKEREEQAHLVMPPRLT